MINTMTYAELLALRMQINIRVDAFEEEALTKLNQGEVVVGFALKAGRSTRFISDKKGYTAKLKEYFGEDYPVLCTETKELALTRIEAAMKSNFDKEDCAEMHTVLKQFIDLKVGAPVLTYIGV